MHLSRFLRRNEIELASSETRRILARALLGIVACIDCNPNITLRRVVVENAFLDILLFERLLNQHTCLRRRIM